MSFVASKEYIDGFVIGIDNVTQIKEIVQINKLKIPKFFPAIKDKNLIDPRFWKKNKILKQDKGLFLWDKASKIILSGNMVLSKRPDLFLPNKWPTYFSRSKGCKVWDISEKVYQDMSLMGVGTNILGYSHKKVDKAVNKIINLGNLTTLNCPEEVHLSEKLIQLHPWADKVKLARTGGEASAISIRIARAATGKDNVAFCGYHGWHDWYLSTNLSNKNNLNDHLLPGLSSKGVVSKLKNTIFPFQYNDYANLKKLLAKRILVQLKWRFVEMTFQKTIFKKGKRFMYKKGNSFNI